MNIKPYYRVSNREQEFKQQEELVENYAKSKGFDLVSGIQDASKGYSLYHMIEGAKAKEHIALTQLNRISRNKDVAVRILEKAQSKGLILHIIGDNLILDNSKKYDQIIQKLTL